MASNEYRTPGVYIEGGDGTHPIVAVETRTAGFVGKAPHTELNPQTALLVNNWTEFKDKFAGPNAAERQTLADAQVALAAKRDQNASVADIVAAEAAVKTATEAINTYYADTDLSNAVYGFFLNGGSRCYVVNIEDDETIDAGLQKLAKIDEITMVAAPGFTTKAAYTAIRDHCDSRGDRLGILDGPETLGDREIKQMSGERVANPSWEMAEPSKKGLLTLYTPWLTVTNPDPDPNKTASSVNVPPSGHVAGIWARSDATHGVHKAPANEPVQGAIDLERHITPQEQDGLNANGVNCIRNFSHEGILVWGARTLTDDDAFRYLNVRRLSNMIVKSIAEGTRWVPFEPNDQLLWQTVQRVLSAFLMEYWRAGALLGSTPEEAFFVKCDHEINTIERINAGCVVIEVGLAPVRPAEFIIFRISQYEAGTDTESY